MKTDFRLIGSASLLTLLVACGGGGGSGTPATVNLTGSAGKGLLIGATVRAYEIIDGQKSQTQWGTTGTTNEEGKYTLSGPPTPNPVLIEVETDSKTLMLDERKPVPGGFEKTHVTENFKLRSFVPSLTNSETIQVNVLTENAIVFAEKAEDSINKKLIGLTPKSLLAGMQIAREQAPDGVNPFNDNVLPSKPEDLKDQKIAKMAVMMAGLLDKGETDTLCPLKCQIQEMSNNVSMQLDAVTGTATVDSPTASQMNKTKKDLLNSGKNVLKLTAELETQGTNSAVNQAIEKANNQEINNTTLPSATYEAINSVEGFIDTLRKSLKTSETNFETTVASLKQKYGKLATAGFEELPNIISLVKVDCITGKTIFSCTPSLNSGLKWSLLSDGTWQGEGTSRDGYSISGIVTGTAPTNNQPATLKLLSASIKDGNKSLITVKNLNGSFYTTKLNSDETKIKGEVKITGGEMAILDQTKDSNLQVTLSLSNITIGGDQDAGTFSIVGDFGLKTDNKDELIGKINTIGLTRSHSQTYPFTNGSLYTNNYINNYIQDIKLWLTATPNAQNALIDLYFHANRILNEKEPIRTPFDTDGYIKLVDNSTRVDFESQNPLTTKSVTTGQTIILTIGNNKLKIQRNYIPNNEWSDQKWCVNENSTIRCAETTELTANDGTYTAKIRRYNSEVMGDLFRKEKRIGSITNKGMIVIDGHEYSLY